MCLRLNVSQQASLEHAVNITNYNTAVQTQNLAKCIFTYVHSWYGVGVSANIWSGTLDFGAIIRYWYRYQWIPKGDDFDGSFKVLTNAPC